MWQPLGIKPFALSDSHSTVLASHFAYLIKDSHSITNKDLKLVHLPCNTLHGLHNLMQSVGKQPCRSTNTLSIVCGNDNLGLAGRFANVYHNVVHCILNPAV